MNRKGNLLRILQNQVSKTKSTLTSGKESHYYIDCRPLVLDPFARVMIASQIALTITELVPIIPCKEFDAIGGPTFSGAIMAVAFSNLVSPYSLIIPFAYHTHKDILIVPEGKIQNVMLVDDVLSTGGTLYAMKNKCEERGWNVLGAVVLVDREEPESQLIRTILPVRSVFTAKEVDDEV